MLRQRKKLDPKRLAYWAERLDAFGIASQMRTTEYNVRKTANDHGVILRSYRAIAANRPVIIETNDQHAAPNAFRLTKERVRPRPRHISRTGGVQTAITATTSGSISELLVAADLMARGYAVYLPVLSSRKHDIIAVLGDEILTFEVRSAHRRASGALGYAKLASDSRSKVYALVVVGEPVLYEPPLPEPA